VNGVSNPQIEVPASQPNLEIQVQLDKARAEGIKPGDVRRAEATLLQGIEVGSVFEDQKVFEVIVKGTPETRSSVAAVRDLLIDKPDGGQVRLGDVADVRVARTPAVIKREAVSRYLDIKADVNGRSLEDVAGEVEDRLANFNLPLEYHAEVLQSTAAREINSTEMLAFGVAALIAMFLLLQAAFRSWRLAALVMLSVPIALVGGVLAALIDGAELSLGSAVGFVAVFGLAVRGSIMLVRHLDGLEEQGEKFGPELVRRGAREQLGTVLASTVGLALVALVFVVLGTRPGLEVVQPMAVVLLGGLVTTTFLNLFVLPALYLRFAGERRATLSPEEELMHRWAGVEPAEATAAPATAAPATAAAPPVQADGDGAGKSAEEGSDPSERQPAV
jgi:Cu/Ag efflux pump CusA